jgi:DNA-binding transcriptional regulator YhcF (GntR family)
MERRSRAGACVITITIDEESAVPPFEQVRAQLEQAITMGAIGTGTHLPTVRQLAHDLGLAPNTVGRSYRALEDAGLIETRGRRGTTVSHVEPVSPTRRSQALRDAAARYHNEAVRLGASLDDALEAVRLHALADGS